VDEAGPVPAPRRSEAGRSQHKKGTADSRPARPVGWSTEASRRPNTRHGGAHVEELFADTRAVSLMRSRWTRQRRCTRRRCRFSREEQQRQRGVVGSLWGLSRDDSGVRSRSLTPSSPPAEPNSTSCSPPASPRNEGVPGSSPGVGSVGVARSSGCREVAFLVGAVVWGRLRGDVGRPPRRSPTGGALVEGSEVQPRALRQYLAVHARSCIAQGGGPELLQQLARVTWGPRSASRRWTIRRPACCCASRSSASPGSE
jgi:hypothetical protein